MRIWRSFSLVFRITVANPIAVCQSRTGSHVNANAAFTPSGRLITK